MINAYTTLTVALVFILVGIRIVRLSERGVVLRLGRFHGVKNPGVTWVIPMVDLLVKVPLIQAFEIPSQPVTTKDGGTVTVGAVIKTKLTDPIRLLTASGKDPQAFAKFVQKIVATTLANRRSKQFGQDREEIQREVRGAIDRETEAWGMTITDVELTATGS